MTAPTSSAYLLAESRALIESGRARSALGRAMVQRSRARLYRIQQRYAILDRLVVRCSICALPIASGDDITDDGDALAHSDCSRVWRVRLSR